MTNKAEDELEELIKIGPGDFLAFGSINLLLTLNLNKNDFSKYKINWEDIQSLNGLKFIRKHKNFLKRIDITSTDNTMNILLTINKTTQKLIKIGYVGLKKMVFQDDQINFQDFIYNVTKQKGLFITSCDVCRCTISIQLLLKYEKEEKLFLLCGKSSNINNSQNKNENKEIKEKKENKSFQENKNKKE